ncbi:MAG: sensor histidine kinase [Acidimicrobiales bacterium]
MVPLAVVPVLLLGLLSAVSLVRLANTADRPDPGDQTDPAVAAAGPAGVDQAAALVAMIEAYRTERVDDLAGLARADVIVDAATTATAPNPDDTADPALTDDLANEAGAFLVSQIGAAGHYRDVVVTDLDGNPIAAAAVGQGQPSAVVNDPVWAEAVATGTASQWSTGADGRPTLTMAVRVDRIGADDTTDDVPTTSTTGPVGVVAATVDPAAVQRLLEVVYPVGADGSSVALYTADSTPVAASTTEVPPLDSAGIDTTASGYLAAGNEVLGWARSADTGTGSDLLAVSRRPIPVAATTTEAADSTVVDEIRSSQWAQGVAALTLALLAGIAAWLLGRRFGERLTTSLDRIRNGTMWVAGNDLPAVSAELAGGADPADVAPPSAVPEVGPREIAEVGAAINALSGSTMALVYDQAATRRRDIETVLLNLGRRNQQLIGRQLRFIDQLEHHESDPDVLRNLFLLDQMATRMRRNAESLLVLAGEDPPRRSNAPQPMVDVLRAAISEVEEYARVSIISAEPVMVRPNITSDLTHLLAELIENATAFSAPEAPVTVLVGAAPDGGCTVVITDQGIGMDDDRLALANERLARGGVALDDAPTSFLGLFVVGRLSSRHEIRVVLRPGQTRGLEAFVMIPAECLAPASPDLAPAASGESESALSLSWPAPAVRPRIADGAEFGLRNNLDEVEALSPLEEPENEGVPIPPYRERRSLRDPAEDDDVEPHLRTFQVRRRIPGQALAQSVRDHMADESTEAPTPSRVSSPGSVEARASEVRDKLTRYTSAVDAAKTAIASDPAPRTPRAAPISGQAPTPAGSDGPRPHPHGMEYDDDLDDWPKRRPGPGAAVDARWPAPSGSASPTGNGPGGANGNRASARTDGAPEPPNSNPITETDTADAIGSNPGDGTDR